MTKKKRSRISEDKTEQGRRNQILGDIAEGQITSWAPQMGFVANPSQKDRTGWDQYFEFSTESPDEVNFPPGMPSGALSCKVQVKGISTGRRNISLKLSTLFNFVEEPIPCFIIVLAYGSDTSQPQKVYLIHISDEIISRVLERICKLSEREKKRLHKKSLSIPLTPRDQIAQPWTESLRQRISDCTGSNLFEYAQKKKQHYETAGFADNYRNFKVTFQAPSAEELNERFSRLAVGLEAVEFIKFEESRVRFDVSFPVRDLPSESGLIQMPPTDQNRSWRLEIVEADLSDPIELSCTVRLSASVFPFLPEDHWLIRIETRFLDMLLRYARNQLTFSFQGPGPDERINLSELYWTCRVLEHFSSTTSSQMMFRVYRDGLDKKNLGAISNPGLSLPDATRDVIKKVKATWLVFRNLDLEPHTLLSLRELFAMQSAVLILEAVFSRTALGIEAIVARKQNFGNIGAIVSFPTIEVGTDVYIFTVAVVGAPRLESLDDAETRVIVESNQYCIAEQSHVPSGINLTIP